MTEKLIGGQLVVTLRSPASAVTVRISSPALKVAPRLMAKAAHRRTGTLRVIITVSPVNAVSRVLSFIVRSPA